MPTASNVNNQIEVGAVLSQNFKTEVTVSKPKKSKWKSTTMIAVIRIVTVHGSLDEVWMLQCHGMNAHFTAMISIAVRVVEAIDDLER